ncbi:MAG: UDP-N-acetylmuramoyl-tripeptide--D-alanyl-D-alanine ligase [Candidatus Omnitrophota bacterium]
MLLSDLIRVTGGSFTCGVEARIKGVSTDSRSMRKGDAFIAIRGPRYDGHDFIGSAVDKGASCVVTSRQWARGKRKKILFKGTAAVGVDDTLKALGDIAHYHRMRFTLPVIAITGSAGKTTTKEMLASIMGIRHNVLKTEGNDNNLIGVPLTLLRLNERHGVCIVEMGTNVPGEIRRLACIARPTMGIITNIGDSHLEGFGTRKNVFLEKKALVDSLGPAGQAILNKDDRFLSSLRPARRAGFFGIKKPCAYRAVHVRQTADGWKFRVRGSKFGIRLVGRHSIYNALACIAAGNMLKIGMKDMAGSLAGFSVPMGNRLAVRECGRITLIDDTYNSNPLSFESALSALADIRGRRRSMVVASDMLELGRKSMYLHREIGKMIADRNVDMLLTHGDMAKYTSGAAARRGMDAGNVRHFPTQDALIDALAGSVSQGDIILVKGSRGMRMERVVRAVESLSGKE